ncbi:SUMF1/EgtB/PvdO family nonheme iron enzyme [Magnetococcus sp. PR-3]|uniref:SUMF1/EgtB/PvdO family nonheme iron enzyme n=1 Tax=Magnetococcus sp. PR-3 TaxID=3120355 RepID=UPI002FCE3F82
MRLEPSHLAEILEQARTDVANQRLSTPVGNNALYKIRRILAHQSDHPEALELLRQAAHIYVDLSTALINQGNPDGAVNYAFLALSLFPEDAKVRQLERDLSPSYREMVKQFRSSWIAETLSNGDINLTEDRLTRPAERNALYRYRQVLEIEPENSRALKGMRRVADRLQLLSQEPGLNKQTARSLAEKAQWIEQNHAALPQSAHPKLRSKEVAPRPRQEAPQPAEAVSVKKPAPNKTQPLKRTTDQAPAQEAKAVVNNTTATTPQSAKPIKVDPLKKEQISKLLQKAEKSMQRERMTVPYHLSALFHFRQTLELDKDNRQAKEGMQRIVLHLIKLAKQSPDKHTAEIYIRRAHSILPQHPAVVQALFPTKAKPKDVVSEPVKQPEPVVDPPQKANNWVPKLLNEAERYLANDRLTRPKGKNALFRFRQVLEVEPNNLVAQTGIKRVAARLLKLAEQEVLTTPKRALKYLRKAHLLDGGNSDIIDFYNRISQLPELAGSPPLAGMASPVAAQKQIPIKAEPLDEMGLFLNKGRDALFNDRLTMPPRRNAQFYFARILQLDPTNPDAVDGLRGVSDRLVELAQRAGTSMVKKRMMLEKSRAILSMIGDSEVTPITTTTPPPPPEQTAQTAAPNTPATPVIAPSQTSAPVQKLESWTEEKTGMRFIHLPAGCFNMGSDQGEDDEKPIHRACIESFWMGQFEVTHKQWRIIMGVSSNPSKKAISGDHPVNDISWIETGEFIERLNLVSGHTFRLPTEAEWEYACRSGGKDEIWSGSNMPHQVAWINLPGEQLSTTQPVGRKTPNGFGLFDMSGNVYEWAEDWYNTNFYANAPERNPINRKEARHRILRGGAWITKAKQSRCTDREWLDPNGRFDVTGFRLVWVQ